VGDIPVRGRLSALNLDWGAPAQLSLAVLPGPTQRLVALVPKLEGVRIPGGKFSGELEASGPVRDPVLRVAGGASLGAPLWQGPAGVEIQATRQGRDLELRADLRQDLETRATLDASATTKVGDLFAALAAGKPLPSTEELGLYVDDLKATTTLIGMPAAS